MKRFAVFILLAACVIMLFSACGNKENITEEDKSDVAAKETDGGELVDTSADIEFKLYVLTDINLIDGGVTATFDNEYPLWSHENCNRHDRDGAPKEMTCEFNGETLSGKYVYSDLTPYNTYQSDYYICTEGNDKFSVNSETGEMDSVMFMVDIDQNPGEMGLDDCRDMAMEIAGRYIDTDLYKLSETSYSGLMNSYIFERYIDGVATAANMYIAITSNGEVSSFGYRMVEEMDNAINAIGEEELHEKVALLTSDEARAAAEDKTKSLFPDMFRQYPKETVLVALEDGSLGVVCVNDVEFHKQTGEDEYLELTYRMTILITAE